MAATRGKVGKLETELAVAKKEKENSEAEYSQKIDELNKKLSQLTTEKEQLQAAYQKTLAEHEAPLPLAETHAETPSSPIDTSRAE